ncbi:MAG: class F sortase [Dehalococcoidia bacterium]
MRSLQIAAVAIFGLGAALLVTGFILRGGSSATGADPGPSPTFQSLQATPTNTARPSPTATPRPTNAPPPTATATPTATPTPFAGPLTRLKIERFGVDSPIEEIGLKANNELDTPHDPLNTGWYYIYDRPGWGGNAVFSAHVDYWPDIIGPFNKLAELELDDVIDIEMENGTLYRYKVVSNHRYSVYDIPMGDIIWPPSKPPEAEWVTLITCGGQFVSASPGGPGEYLHRDVVVAERFQ